MSECRYMELQEKTQQLLSDSLKHVRVAALAAALVPLAAVAVSAAVDTEQCASGACTPSCTIPATREIISNTSWNRFNVPAGTIPVVWVHAQFKPTGVPSNTSSTVQFTGVSFVMNRISPSMPDGLCTLDPATSS